jgi:hypothetical protein
VRTLRRRRRFTWQIEVSGHDGRDYPWGNHITVKGPATPAGAISKAMAYLASRAARETIEQVRVAGKEPYE